MNPRCPNCGSTNIEEVPWVDPDGEVDWEGDYYCWDCDHEFDDSEALYDDEEETDE